MNRLPRLFGSLPLHISRACLLLAMHSLLALVSVSGVSLAAETPPAHQDSLQRQVAETERAFAKTMADRDLAAFGRFISPEAVFISDGKTLRGRQKVIDAWRKLYDGASAPFSWEPQTVEVLDSGQLALSTGPVRDSAGKLVGTFTSIWRLEAPDTWHIIFDSGCEACARCATDSH